MDDLKGLLPRYCEFATAVERLAERSSSLKQFSSDLKNAAPFVELRKAAASEIRALYLLIAQAFRLPVIPVYLTLRKRVRLRGSAVYRNALPKEIRIYSLSAPSKLYHNWTPRDIRTLPTEELLEAVIHESAHVLDLHRYGQSDHDENFKRSFLEIREFLVGVGYEDLLHSPAQLIGSPNPPPKAQLRTPIVQGNSRGQSGCLSLGAFLAMSGLLIYKTLIG